MRFVRRLIDRLRSVQANIDRLQGAGVPACPVAFLGAADHFEMRPGPMPMAPCTLFNLSTVKSQLFYPAPITAFWVFLIDTISLPLLGGGVVFRIVRVGDGSDELGMFGMQLSAETAEGAKNMPTDPTPPNDSVTTSSFVGAVLPFGRWLLFPGQLVNAAIPRSGDYRIVAKVGTDEFPVGEMKFLYNRRAPFTLDEQRALQADPYGSKFARLTLGCKKCDYQFRIYTGLNRDKKSEEEGFVWQHDVPESYTCTCGATSESLRYVRESMHAILGRDVRMDANNISFGRRYGHDEILRILGEFNALLAAEKDEAPFQKFIEQYPVMLARFNAREIKVKPTLLGKREPDFVVLDVQGILWFIELEPPSLALFKKSDENRGHQLAGLTHAYDQIRDWKLLLQDHRLAVLDVMGFKPEQVMGVRWVVIGGRSIPEERDMLRRLLSVGPQDTDFMTLDDLGESLFRISRDLA